MSVNRSDVVVVGGGIGGLASALALAKTGHNVCVLEKAAEFTEVGAGLQMAPNATRILAQWGLLDGLLEVGVAPRHLVFRDAISAEELTRLDLGAVFVERYGAPYIVVHRTDLLALLLSACEEAGVALLVSSHVTEVDAPSGTVVTADGRSFRGEVVLAADGLRSGTRELVDRGAPVDSGYVAYRGAFPVSHLDSPPPEEVVVHIGPGCHLVQYPLRRGEILNTVAVFRSPGHARGEEDWGGPDELDAAFVDASEEVRTALSALWRDRYWTMHDREPLARWVEGKVVLTGDAAHPMLQYLAQGACQAIEDAAALGGLAARLAPGDNEVAWASLIDDFERERVPRTARVQTTARTWGEIWHVDGVARLLRNELFRSRDTDDFTHVDWLYGSQHS